MAAVAGFFLLLAFDVPILNAVKQLPLLSSLWHFYFASFAMLALPLLAAHGIDHWFSRERALRDMFRPAIVAVIGFALSGLVFLLYREHLATIALESNVMIAVFFGLLCVLAIGAAMFAPRRIAFSAAAIVVAAELLYATNPLHPTVARRLLYPETALTAFLTDQTIPKRVSVKSGDFPAELGAGILPAYGVPQLWGYDGITPNRILEFLGLAADSATWERVEPVAAVEYYLFQARDDWSPGDKFSAETSLNGLTVWRNEAAWRRATLVPSLRRVGDAESVLSAMGDESFKPRDVVITDAETVTSFESGVLGDESSARVVAYSSNEVTVTTETPQQSVLVLSDAYDPNWRAYIGGEETPVFPAYHAFRGVVVPPGAHEVVFRYEPRAFWTGFWISIAGTQVGMWVAVAMLLARRKRG